MPNLNETLGPVGISVLQKLGAPKQVMSQLVYDDIQIQGADLSLWRLDITKVWRNTSSFSFAVKLWCNVSPTGDVCAQANAQKVPHTIKGQVDRTFNISGKVSFDDSFFTAQEIETLELRATATKENPKIEFGHNGEPCLFLKCEHPTAKDGIGFTVSTDNVFSNTSQAMVDVVNLKGLAIEGLRLGGNDIAGSNAEQVKAFIPRGQVAPQQPTTIRPPVAPLSSTQYTFEVIH